MWRVLLVSIAVAGAARAQTALSVDALDVAPGTPRAALSVDLASTVDLTRLLIDITFDPALCGILRNQSLARAGRTLVTPEEGGVFCPSEGRVRFRAADLFGERVIPAGDGEILRWLFDVSVDAAPGVYPVHLRVIDARNGPLRLSLTDARTAIVISAPAACAGDCNGDAEVTVDELVRGVGIALGAAPIDECPAMDGGGDGAVTVDDLVKAVNNALTGCAGADGPLVARNAR